MVASSSTNLLTFLPEPKNTSGTSRNLNLFMSSNAHSTGRSRISKVRKLLFSTPEIAFSILECLTQYYVLCRHVLPEKYRKKLDLVKKMMHLTRILIQLTSLVSKQLMILLWCRILHLSQRFLMTKNLNRSDLICF